MAYKILRKLSKEERDSANINIIKKKEWVKHYKDLWYSPTSPDVEIGTVVDVIDCIEMSELQEVLKTAKKRKASGTDNLNSELLKYGGTLLHEKLLNYLTCARKNVKYLQSGKRQKTSLSLKKEIEIAVETIEK